MTLQQAVFAGLVDPGNLISIRRIVTPTDAPYCGPVGPTNPAPNCDTAAFSGPRGNYTITTIDPVLPNAAVDALGNPVGDPGGAAGYLQVTDNVGTDGTDIVRNVEKLQFTDTTVSLIPAPAISTPATLAFVNQNTLSTSPAGLITITNSGTAPLVLGVASLGGLNADQFALTNNCVNVAAGFSCSISVFFTPTSIGAKTATVSISSNAGAPTVVTISGTGVTPAASASGPLAFGNQTVLTTSVARTITVTNTGSGALVVPAGGVTVIGTNATDFLIASNTCTTVAPAGTCTIGVTFRPAAVGAKTASVSISHNAVGTPTTVALTGTGVAAAVVPPAPPTATTSATVADTAFGTVRRLTTRTRTALVTNTGTANLSILSVTPTTGQVSVALGTCNVPVAPGRTCKLDVTFSPTLAGASSTPLTLSLNGSTTHPTAVVTGTGR
jgi:hypothetical protein